MVSASQALDRLREGNRRFVAGVSRRDPREDAARRAATASGQAPFAVLLGCSDSRVSPELVFDQGPGELFVVRVAGHVAGPAELGSIEFAVDRLGTRLVMVLGHSGCGAVTATLEALGGADLPSPHLRFLVERIQPALESLPPEPDAARQLARAVRAHVEATRRQVERGSEIVAERIERDGLRVVGAEYDLETGVVDLLDARAARDGGARR